MFVPLRENGSSMDAEKKPKPQSNTLLRRQRELRNFTLQDVADKLYEMCVKEGRESGISADTVGRWERGISQPEAHYRAKLCELFGKSTTDLGLIEQKHLLNPLKYTLLSLPLLYLLHLVKRGIIVQI